MVTAKELAAQLGLHPTTFRGWLRNLVGQDHPLVRGHAPWERWIFSDHEGRRLVDLYSSPRHGFDSVSPALHAAVARTDRPPLIPSDVTALPVDERTRRYLTKVLSSPGIWDAQIADARFESAASRTVVLWHEPSAWATRSGLGLYGLDLELRRLAGVLPELFPELASIEELLAFPETAQLPLAEPEEFGIRQPRREPELPRPIEAQRTRMEIVDAAPGTLTVLLQAVGALVDVLNSYGVTALVNAIAIAGTGVVGARIGIRVLHAPLLTGKRLTIRLLRRALRALGDEPQGRFAVLVRTEGDGSRTLVIIESY